MTFKFPIYRMSEMIYDYIADAEISERSKNALLRNGYRMMYELVDNFDQLDKVRGLGKKGISEVKKYIVEYSFNRLDKAEQEDFLRYVAENNPWLDAV